MRISCKSEHYTAASRVWLTVNTVLKSMFSFNDRKFIVLWSRIIMDYINMIYWIYVKLQMIFVTNDQSEWMSLLLLKKVRLRTSDPPNRRRWSHLPLHLGIGMLLYKVFFWIDYVSCFLLLTKVHGQCTRKQIRETRNLKDICTS